MVGQMSTTKRRFGIRVFVLWFVTLWIIAALACLAGCTGGIGEPCNRDGTCQGDLVCAHTGVIGTTIGAPIHRCILRESFK